MSSWKSNEIFPKNIYQSLVLVKNGEAVFDRAKIQKLVKAWNPLSDTLVADGGTHLLPPICVSSTTQIARKSFLTKYGISVVIWLLAACFVLFKESGNHKGVGISMVALGLALYFIVDFFVLYTNRGLEERARFIYWIRHSRKSRVAFAWALLFSLVLGVTQLLLVHNYGSSTAVIQKYGLVFQDARSGEWWRYISGAYIHADLVHYIGNVSILIPLFAFSWLLHGRHSIFAFLAGNLTASIFSSLNHFGGFDAFAGISAGVFALFGLIFGCVLIKRVDYPRFLSLNIAILALFSLLASQFLNGNSLVTTHSVGFLVGCAYSLITFMRKVRA